MKILYSTGATSHGNGRDGRVVSDDGAFDLKLAVPKALGGAEGAGSNPEQLFAAGYAACFHSALRMIGGQEGVEVDASTVRAQVGIGQNGEGGFALDVSLHVEMPGASRAEAEAVVAKAHQTCPYSNAVRGNVEVRLNVNES